MVIFFIRTQIEHSLGGSNVLILSFTYFQILYRRTSTGSVNFINYKFCFFQTEQYLKYRFQITPKNSLGHLNMIWKYAKLSIKTFERPSECSICVLMKNITIMVESVRFHTQVYVVPNHVQMFQGMFWSGLKSISEVLIGLENKIYN